MDSKVLHNLKKFPFNERETFNNAILLLSMVKSEYYYIVGFSRPENKIEVGFDLEDKAYGKISETVTMDFSSDTNDIRVYTQLANIILKGGTVIPFNHKDGFTTDNSYVYYERLFEKDDVIPVSMEKLNTIILSVKKDIEVFVNQSLAYILKNANQKRI